MDSFRLWLEVSGCVPWQGRATAGFLDWTGLWAWLGNFSWSCRILGCDSQPYGTTEWPLYRQGFLFVSLCEWGFRTSSKASITHCDLSQAELPTRLPEQTSRLAQLCRWTECLGGLSTGAQVQGAMCSAEIWGLVASPTVLLSFCLILGVKSHRFPGKLWGQDPSVPAGKCPTTLREQDTPLPGAPSFPLEKL